MVLRACTLHIALHLTSAFATEYGTATRQDDGYALKHDS